jgi:hypothetical protein
MSAPAKEKAIPKYAVTPTYINKLELRSLPLLVLAPPRRRRGTIPAPTISLRIQRKNTTLNMRAAALDGNSAVGKRDTCTAIIIF